MLHYFSCVRLFATLYGLLHARLLCQWDSLGKNTRVGCSALLQGIFQTRIEPASFTSPALAGGFVLFCFTTSTTWETLLLLLLLLSRFSRVRLCATP